MRIVSVREEPAFEQRAIAYFQSKWATPDSRMVYEDCIHHCLTAKNPLPEWYLLLDGNEIIGCTGLVTNDFISRMDLYPWLVALYIEEAHRGHAYATLLIDRVKADTKNMGYPCLYLSTDHIGYYERYGWRYIGTGYHPWGENSRIYEIAL
ncbi:GNAT family N-acetyltransferase [Christensenellaceae bacterium OttesenSCG-928-M15]|nr:GNAT family N-acetyltransferase [Christensenellaceae bacterium OttesenSCG-928-M15]